MDRGLALGESSAFMLTSEDRYLVLLSLLLFGPGNSESVRLGGFRRVGRVEVVITLPLRLTCPLSSVVGSKIPDVERGSLTST